jgi:hypothetical protein
LEPLPQDRRQRDCNKHMGRGPMPSSITMFWKWHFSSPDITLDLWASHSLLRGVTQGIRSGASAKNAGQIPISELLCDVMFTIFAFHCCVCACLLFHAGSSRRSHKIQDSICGWCQVVSQCRQQIQHQLKSKERMRMPRIFAPTKPEAAALSFVRFAL